MKLVKKASQDFFDKLRGRLRAVPFVILVSV